MNFNFGEILTRAWQIIWKHKIMWLFGILASCSRGGGGGGSGAGNSGFNRSDSTPFDSGTFDRFGQWVSDNLWIVVVLVILVLLLIVIFAFLGTIGKIGLIKGTYKAEQGAAQLVLSELFSESMPYFWRVFGLSFLIGLVFLVILIPFILFGVLTAGIGLVCLLPLICILIPVSWVVSVIIEQANAAMVLEDLGMMDGLRRGWEIVKSNIGPALIMLLILGVIGFVVGFVVAIPILIVVVPAAIAYAVGNAKTNTPLFLMGVCICLYLPIAIVAQGVVVAYIQSAWTLTYMRLTDKPESGDTAPRIDNPVKPEDSDKTLLASPNA